jgi:hypothetical protein
MGNGLVTGVTKWDIFKSKDVLNLFYKEILRIKSLPHNKHPQQQIEHRRTQQATQSGVKSSG